MMKKLFAVAIVIAILIGMGGCGKKQCFDNIEDTVTTTMDKMHEEQTAYGVNFKKEGNQVIVEVVETENVEVENTID